MFYELLVDVLPQGHWQPPSGGRSDVPLAIDDLIQRGLSNRPASRPQSASEYGELLLAAGQKGGSRSLTGSNWSLPVWVKQHKLKLLIAGILLAAAAGSEAWDTDFGSEPSLGLTPDPDADTRTGSRDSAGLAALSGTWFDGYGGGYDVQVNSGGEFFGSGVSPDGYPLAVEGRLAGRSLAYRIGVQGQVAATGTGRWDGRRHLSYQSFNPDGSPNLGGYFHVNHEPSDSCP